MTHMNAISREKINSPIKIEGDGCLSYGNISRFINLKEILIFLIKDSQIML